MGIVVDQEEVRNGSLDNSILPQGLSACEDFRKDLNMSGAYWYYHKFGQNDALKRVLLLQRKTDKADAKEMDIRKSYRGLGVTACQQLQAKKASEVNLLVSDKVADKELLGIFENSLQLSNYENSHK